MRLIDLRVYGLRLTPVWKRNWSGCMATILVVDDRAINRKLLITLLDYADHIALEAADAEQALTLVRAALPDLVIIDVLLPSVNGFEFVHRLRSEPAIAQTRVMFYTATYLEPEARRLAEACGVRHVLAKPNEPQIILDMVRQALSEPKAISAALPAAEFDQEHGWLLIKRLAQIVDELETLKADLERRVQDRTAEPGPCQSPEASAPINASTRGTDAL